MYCILLLYILPSAVENIWGVEFEFSSSYIHGFYNDVAGCFRPYNRDASQITVGTQVLTRA